MSRKSLASSQQHRDISFIYKLVNHFDAADEANDTVTAAAVLPLMLLKQKSVYEAMPLCTWLVARGFSQENHSKLAI